MKNLIPLALIFAFLTSEIVLQAQNLRWSVEGNFGLSEGISKTTTPDDIIFFNYPEFEPSPKLMINYGGNLEIKIGKKSAFKTGLHFFTFKNSERAEIDLFVSTGPASIPISDPQFVQVLKQKFKFSYFGIPISYKYQYKNIGFDLGFQALFFLNGNFSSTSEIYIEGELSSGSAPFTAESELDFRKLNVGPSLGISYDLNQRFSIQSTYYYGLTNQYKTENNSPFEPRRYLQFLNLGLRYYY